MIINSMWLSINYSETKEGGLKVEKEEIATPIITDFKWYKATDPSPHIPTHKYTQRERGRNGELEWTRKRSLWTHPKCLDL